ncbi:alpha/beta hydrolase [Phyllobacterium sp. LjRoot231]|uniref:alpha/beta hydrolase n=1 Tax=Phyllobacterium sp. LjRoot231 TaxID=3342289 RepID=UPI003ECEB1BE
MTGNQYVHRMHSGALGKPVFFVLHGTGGDENQFFEFGRQVLPDATIVAPRGDVSEHGAARFFKRTAEGVYDMGDLQRATTKMVAFVNDIASTHQASAIIGLGFSNGANILANVLIKDGVFDAAVLMHPLIPFQPAPNPGLAGRRILITAGKRDPISPVVSTLALETYLSRQNTAVTTEWHSGGHEIQANEIDAVKAFLIPYK